MEKTFGADSDQSHGSGTKKRRRLAEGEEDLGWLHHYYDNR